MYMGLVDYEYILTESTLILGLPHPNSVDALHTGMMSV